MARRLVVCCVLSLLGLSLVGATTLLEMKVADLTREADAIVVGTVARIDGEWDPSLNFIRSNVTLRVERTIRGQAGETIVLRNPGGFVGGMGQKAHGAAEFEIGERVMVFLTTWEDGPLKVLGYAQGKSRVVDDGPGRQRLVGGSAHGLTIDGALVEIEHGPVHNIPLRPAR